MYIYIYVHVYEFMNNDRNNVTTANNVNDDTNGTNDNNYIIKYIYTYTCIHMDRER